MSSHCLDLLAWKLSVCFLHGPSSQECLRACLIYELECEGESAASIPPEAHKAALAEFDALSNQALVKIGACPVPGLISLECAIKVIKAARAEMDANTVA